MQRDFRYLDQVQVGPLNAVAFFVGDLEIPMDMLLAILESDLDTLAVGQGVFAENIFFPIVGAMGRDIERVNLNAGVVMQDEILLASASQRRGRDEQCDHAEREQDS